MWITCSGGAESTATKHNGTADVGSDGAVEPTRKPARVFAEFNYHTRKAKNRGWKWGAVCGGKAEHIDGKENPGFVVTSLSGERWAAQTLYEELYCAATWRTASRNSSACLSIG